MKEHHKPVMESVRQFKGMLKIANKLTQIELEDLATSCYKQLLRLNAHYTPEIDLADGIPLQSDYIDVLRGLWLNDSDKNRPSFNCLVDGVGYVFGLILANLYEFDWHVIEQEGIECISLVKIGRDKEIISVPPFSYVEKREVLQNVEVFSDFFKQSNVAKIIA